jgi:hypothetical protein
LCDGQWQRRIMRERGRTTTGIHTVHKYIIYQAIPTEDPTISVADTDPGSGDFLNPGSRSGSGMNIPDHISESLETIFGLKLLNFFNADSDPEFGIFLNLDLGSGIRNGKIRIQDLV